MNYLTRQVSFQNKTISISYRDDSDASVIDEFFVDKMYRSLNSIIPKLTNPVLDIGAHIGVFTLYARVLNPDIKIIALEPHTDNAKLFQKNMKANEVKHVQLIPCALTHTDDATTTLYISENTHNHTTAVRARHAWPLQGHINTQTPTHVTVPCMNLRDILTEINSPIGLVKIDIEGGEFEIIEHLSPHIFAAIEYMVIEYHETKEQKYHDLEHMIRPHGFSIEHFGNKFDKRFGLLVGRNKRVHSSCR